MATENTLNCILSGIELHLYTIIYAHAWLRISRQRHHRCDLTWPCFELDDRHMTSPSHLSVLEYAEHSALVFFLKGSFHWLWRAWITLQTWLGIFGYQMSWKQAIINGRRAAINSAGYADGSPAHHFLIVPPAIRCRSLPRWCRRSHLIEICYSTQHSNSISRVYSHVNRWTVHEGGQPGAQHSTMSQWLKWAAAAPSRWLIASLFFLLSYQRKNYIQRISFRGNPATRLHVNFPVFMCACVCSQKRVNGSHSQNVNNCCLMFHPLPLLTTSVTMEQCCHTHEEKAAICKQVIK